jgi:mycothiol synthase
VPAELRLREPNEADAPAIAELVNEHARSLFGESELTEGEIRHWLGLPNIWFRLAERDGLVLGYLDVQNEQAQGTRFDVDARTLDAETAAELVGAAEDHARQRANPGAVVRGWAASNDEILGRTYERAGFATIRHSFQMRIELEREPPSPAWPKGVAIRTLKPGEEERVYEATDEAFQDHWDYRSTSYEEWRRWSVDHPKFDPSLWFVADDGEEIAGLSLCAWHFSGDPEFGWVASLSVRRPWRRHGLGLALLHHSFREFRSRGATRVGLGVDAENTTGAVRLYERAGMHVVRRSDTWEKAL